MPTKVLNARTRKSRLPRTARCTEAGRSAETPLLVRSIAPLRKYIAAAASSAMPSDSSRPEPTISSTGSEKT